MHGITALLLAEHDDAVILERIDDAIGDYIDQDCCERDFAGDIFEYYNEKCNREAENQVIKEVLTPYWDDLDDDEIGIVMDELAEMWGVTLH